MEFQNKYPSELSDEDIIPFTAEALEVVETVVSFFCECLNKNEPKFITLLNGNLSPKKEDINLHPSLDNDPTEKICQETPLYKKPTVFKYGKPENNELTEIYHSNDLNTSFDDCINDTDNIINKIENEFNNNQKYDNSSMFSSDSEDIDDDGAPACVLAAKKNINSKVNMIDDEDNIKNTNEEKEKLSSHINLSKKTSAVEEITETKNSASNLNNKSHSSTIIKSKSKDQNSNEEDDLDFQIDDGEKKDDEQQQNKENKLSEGNLNEDDNFNESLNPLEDNEDNFDEGNFDEGNFDEGNFDEGNFDEGNFDEGNFDEGNFDEGNFDEGNFNNESQLKSSSQQQISDENNSSKVNENGNEAEEEDIKKDVSNSHQDIDNESEKEGYPEQTVMPTPMPNLEEMVSKFSSRLSISLEEEEYYNNPNYYHDSNDEINFIPIQEKNNSNCIRWKYHIKHHSTNKKLRCSNFLIIWSQPTKINPVPKATAEMWMIYYHTSNVGRNDATITYRFNGYYNTHEINVHKFMKEYSKYKANPDVEITKKDFPILYTPLILNPKKWLPELIRSKLLISNEIMNKTLLTD